MNQQIVRPACRRCTGVFAPGEVMLEAEHGSGWVHDWDCAPARVDRAGWAQRQLDRWRDGGNDR